MVLIFKEILKNPLCSVNIKECVELSNTGFKGASTICGIGSDPYELLNPSDSFVFSSTSENHSISIVLRKKYYVKIKSFYIKSKINVASNCYWAFPTNFSLYGSNMFNSWHKIYSYGGSILQTRDKSIKFNLSKTSKAYSMFKLDFEKFDKAPPYWNGIHTFDLEGEFSNPELKSCAGKSNRDIMLISILVMLCYS